MDMDKALEKYRLLLQKERAVKAELEKSMIDIEIAKSKAKEWFARNGTEVDAPEWLMESDPETFWKVAKKSDGVVGRLYMHIKERVIPEIEKPAQDRVESLKDVLKDIQTWCLSEMIERKSDSFNVRGVCTCSRREYTMYNVNDKSVFVKDALENGYVSEVTVSVRPNSKLMKQIVEERGELPGGITSYKEYKAVFTK